MKYTTVNKPPRLTITLGQGQREALVAIADRNHTTLACIVRCALDRFLEEQRQKQLGLEL